MVTDGRLSGASGKVPSAIHLTPEALGGGLLAKVRDGDLIRLDVDAGRLDLLVADEVLTARASADPGIRAVRYGVGRQIFAPLRNDLQSAEEGRAAVQLCRRSIRGDRARSGGIMNVKRHWRIQPEEVLRQGPVVPVMVIQETGAGGAPGTGSFCRRHPRAGDHPAHAGGPGGHPGHQS